MCDGFGSEGPQPHRLDQAVALAVASRTQFTAHSLPNSRAAALQCRRFPHSHEVWRTMSPCLRCHRQHPTGGQRMPPGGTRAALASVARGRRGPASPARTTANRRPPLSIATGSLRQSCDTHMDTSFFACQYWTKRHLCARMKLAVAQGTWAICLRRARPARHSLKSLL